MASYLLDDLNPEQRAAVTHGEGPLLVLAGAGSGKTRVIVHRIAHLVAEQGVHPLSILAVTFTNKAAAEMRDRLRALLGPEIAGIWVRTFHATGAALLRREAEAVGLQPNFTIYDENDTLSLTRRVLRDANQDSSAGAVQDLLQAIDQQKNRVAGWSPSEFETDLIGRYQAALRAANAVDFNDLLALPVALFEQRPDILEKYQRRFEYVLVDEFQDTNLVQYRLLQQLSPPGGNLCVVGDDDQSIYRWRGAEVGHILNFEGDYAGTNVVTLTRNYRSDGHILEAAQAVIAHNPHRHPKELWTERPLGAKLSLLFAENERHESDLVAEALQELHRGGMPYREMAVFYRINAQSRVLEEGLRMARIPYVVVRGRSFFERAEVKDAVAYLRLMINPRSDVDLLRVINSPPRGIGDATVERLSAYAAGEGICLYDAIAAEELSLITDLNAAARNRLAGFRRLLEELIGVAAGTAGDAAQAAVTLSGLEQRLADLDTEEADDRLGNLKEFVQAAGEFDVRQADLGLQAAEPGTDRAGDRTALVQFLEEVSLLGDADGEGGEAGGQDRVSVMTLHAAKGLEFTAVVMLGLEEGNLPHARALKPMAEPAEMEEERRLCYVGITRAKRRLFLSCAQCRILFGEFRRNRISRFLEDIPTQLFERPPPRGEPPAPAGRHIDYSYDQTFRPAPSLYPRLGAYPRRAPQRRVAVREARDPDTGTGNLVRHPTFGLGRVVAADGEGPDAKLTVVFNSGATKRLVARFVQPA